MHAWTRATRPRRRALLYITCAIAGLLAGCSIPLALGQATGEDGICAQEITPEAMGMDLDAAARPPFLVEQGGLPIITTLGLELARQRASVLLAVGTFCDEDLPPAIAQVLEQALELLHRGETSQAVALMRTLLAQGARREGRSPGLARSLPQAVPNWRPAIKATLDFASELAVMGEEGAAEQVMDQVKGFFHENALRDLENADLDECLRIAKEATLLGDDEVEQKALQRARNIVKQRLEEALKDFDPCLPNPDVIRQDIKDLLNLLRDAILIGVKGTYGANESLRDQVMAKVQKAIENLDRLARGEPPQCGYMVEFTLEGAAGWATLTGRLHSCSGVEGPWTGSLVLQYDDGMNWRCSGSTTLEYSLPQDASTAGGTLVFPLACVSVERECVVNSASEVSEYLFEFAADGSQVTITIGSNGQASLTETCYFDPEDPDTVHIPAMAFFFGENMVTVPLQAYQKCP